MAFSFGSNQLHDDLTKRWLQFSSTLKQRQVIPHMWIAIGVHAAGMKGRPDPACRVSRIPGKIHKGEWVCWKHCDCEWEEGGEAIGTRRCEVAAQFVSCSAQKRSARWREVQPCGAHSCE